MEKNVISFCRHSRHRSTFRCFILSKDKDAKREIRSCLMTVAKQRALPSSRLEEKKQKQQNLTVAKIESKSTRGLAVNARRSCVDIDAAS